MSSIKVMDERILQINKKRDSKCKPCDDQRKKIMEKHKKN